MDTPLGIKDLPALFRHAKFQEPSKGEVFQTSEDAPTVNLILSGFVKRYFIAHNGKLGIQAIYGGGDVFPLTVMFEALFSRRIYEGPETYYYEAMTSTKLLSLTGENLRRGAESNPLIYRDLLQKTSLRFHSNIQFLENLRLHGAYAKTAHQLVYFGQRFGNTTGAGIRIALPLTHQDLADIIGTTRETVTTSVIKLRDKNLLTTGRHIVIRDMDKLTAEAYS